eukprot:gene17042-17228_t
MSAKSNLTLGRLMLAGAAVMAISLSPALISSASAGAPCRDAKGKFIKCAPAPAKPKPKSCRDAKGKFIKCPA